MFPDLRSSSKVRFPVSGVGLPPSLTSPNRAAKPDSPIRVKDTALLGSPGGSAWSLAS